MKSQVILPQILMVIDPSLLNSFNQLLVFFQKPETPFRNCDSPSRRMGSNQLPEFNEHILKNMIESLGIDRQKTLEVCWISVETSSVS